MASIFRAPNQDSSRDSMETSKNEIPTASADGNPSSTESVRPISGISTPLALTRLNNAQAQLQNIQPHQHATLLQLSLIEARCRTQAASILNAGRHPIEHLPEHHPEVDSLAESLFNDMSKALHQAGILPDEFAGRELKEIRKNYLSTFDGILEGIATQKQRKSEANNTYSSLFDRSDAVAINKNLFPASATNLSTFALQQYNMAPGMISRLRSMSIQDTPYRKQFREQCLLGKGGFGKVYKAIHTLDGHAYAIKKVVMRVDGDLNPEDKAKQMMAEIRALSCLDHRNIVRYHHCWTESLPAELLADSSSDESESEEETDAAVAKFGNDKTIHKRLARELRHDRQVSRMQEIGDNIVFANSASAAPGAVQDKALTKKRSFFRSPDDDSSSSGGSNGDSPDNKYSADNGYSTEEIPRDTKIVPKSAVFDVVLFIQMSLHPMSMEDYLWPEQQTSGEVKIEHCYHCLPTARILLGVLNGVEYIHRNKIVHRDLKPANILLSISHDPSSLLDGSIKVSECPECSGRDGKELYITPHIGDFGLVQEIQDPEVSDPFMAPLKAAGSSKTGIKLYTPPLQSIATLPGPKPALKSGSKDRISQAPVHTSGVGLSTRQPGTRFYVAPKSAKGKNVICPKVDVYSLGVIAFEMVYKFNTKTERAIELEKLKDGVFPLEFDKNNMASGIKSMLCNEREQRWGCAEVRKWLDTVIQTETASLKKDCA